MARRGGPSTPSPRSRSKIALLQDKKMRSRCDANEVENAKRLDKLPQELWEKILAAIKTKNPCDEIVKLCALNQQWANMCRSGELYDLANRALGWYGKQGTWPAVLALYAALKQDPPGDGTAKAYFRFACNTHFDKFNRHIAPWHPFYEAKLLAAARDNNPPILDMATVPWYVSNYDRIARLLISTDYEQLQSVNPEHPGLKKLALDTFDYWGSWNDAAPGVPHHGLRTTHVWFQGFREHPLFQEVLTIVVRKHGWEALTSMEGLDGVSGEFYG